MSAIALRISSPNIAARSISWEEFQRKYLSREDKYKYEWVRGQVEKTLIAMDQSQLYIQTNLIRFLYRLKAVNPNIDGDLVSEADAFFAGNHRRPDMAYYTNEQIKNARKEYVTVDFVIEIISKNDQIQKVADKMEDYRRAGVQVVWQIFPQRQEIHVYRGKQMTICVGDDLCSAEPVIEGFVLPTSDIFA